MEKEAFKIHIRLKRTKMASAYLDAVVRGSALKAWSLRSDIGAYLVILRRCVFVAGIVRSWHNARGLCAHWSAAAFRPEHTVSLCLWPHCVQVQNVCRCNKYDYLIRLKYCEFWTIHQTNPSFGYECRYYDTVAGLIWPQVCTVSSW